MISTPDEAERSEVAAARCGEKHGGSQKKKKKSFGTRKWSVLGQSTLVQVTVTKTGKLRDGEGRLGGPVLHFNFYIIDILFRKKSKILSFDE